MFNTVRAVPKAVNHKRGSKTWKQNGAITPRVDKEVKRRWEENPGCEMCRRTIAYCFERAHLQGKGQYGRGDLPWNIAILCGPQVNTGTCHWKVDNTREGREAAKELSDRLKEQYNVEEWG